MALKESVQLPLNSPIIDFRLRATDGKEYSPADFKGKKGLLVIFTCNHCPYAQASWPILVDLYKQYGGDVGFAAINPNDEQNYPDDSFAAMKERVGDWNIPFPYLRDDSQGVAKEYKAQCTPDPYLYKNEGGKFTLFYHGRINDNWQEPEKVTEHNLKQALDRLLANSSPPEQQPPSMGCSIKWKDGD